MKSYQLAFDDLEVARIRRVDATSTNPLAWFRVIWRPGSNEVETVHVYGHGETIPDRQWLARAPSIAAAVAYCDQLESGEVPPGDYDWDGGTIETSPGR